MLNENIRVLRKSKGLSQEELAAKLNVVRQTVSKWEQGLSAPDSDMLMAISDALGAPVSTLLGETVKEAGPDELKAISEKLEVINHQLARRRADRRRALTWTLIALCVMITVIFAVVIALGSPYQDWDWSDPELAIVGTACHAFEWVFIRTAPFALIGAAVLIALIHRKD